MCPDLGSLIGPLARAPHMVTLRAIIEAIDGPIALNRCVARRGACPLQRQCSVHRVWQRIQDHLLDELERTTIASLVPPRAAS